MFVPLLFSADSVPCGDPEQPPSSQVAVEVLASSMSASYSCLKGFRMEGGDERRECLKSGVWGGRAPTCRGELSPLLGL